MPVTVDIHRGRVAEFLGPRGPVVRRFVDVGRLTLAAAQRRCPVDTGQARASLGMDVDVNRRRVKVTVGSPLQHVYWLNVGTGVYGPRGRPIRPRRSKYLVFEGADGDLVFATQVRGTRPRPFLVEALEEASPWPVTRSRLVR